MKRIILFAMVSLSLGSAFAQSEKYLKKMGEMVPQVDTTRDAATLESMANTFERIGDAEKTQWLPFYYASLCHLNAAYMKIAGKMGGTADITDPAADKAEALLNKALAQTTESSETWVLKKMIASLRMMGDPMNRYMQYGAEATEALSKAKQLNPNNPRIYLLEGQDKYYTPEQFGGSKTEAKKLLEKAKELYAAFKPETAIHPTWGLPVTMYFLSLPQ